MRNFTLLITLIISLSIPAFLTAQGTYNPNQIIVDFAEGVSQADIDAYLDLINGTIVDQIDDDKFLIEIESFPIEYTDINGEEVVFYNVINIIERDQNNADIDHSNLNFDISGSPLTFQELIESLPVDSYSPIPGYLNNYPGVLSCPGIFMNRKVKVGIIDTGIDHGHSFLTDYVVYEANVINDQFSAIDDNGHGTGVAGIIVGLAKSAGILPEFLEIYVIKALDENGVGSYFNLVKAVEMANDLDLDIINLSWGFRYDLDLPENISGGGPAAIVDWKLTTSKLEESIGAVTDRLVICGAGNDGYLFTETDDEDGFFYGPADFGLLNKLTVGALNQLNQIAEFSNRGLPIDVFAPGTGILAPTLNGHWANSNSGTSFSSAIVTGIAIQYFVNSGSESGGYSSNGSISLSSDFQLRQDIINNSINTGVYFVPINRRELILKIYAVDMTSVCTENNNLSISSFANSTQNYFTEEIEKNGGVSFQYFPNPFFENIKINILKLEKGEGRLSILKLNGENVFSKSFFIENDGDEYFISLNLTNLNLPSAMYLLKIQQENNIIIERINKY